MPLRIRTAVLAAALGALLAAGCGSSHHSVLSPDAATRAAGPSAALTPDPREPGATLGMRGFYPLAPGNRWHYQRAFSAVMFDSLGVEIGNYDIHSTAIHEQTCVQDVGARRYQIERDLETTDGQTSVFWIWYRQDAGGLYEADTTGMPGCEADGKDVGLVTGVAAAGRPIEEGGGAEERAIAALVAVAPSAAARAAYVDAWQRLRERVALVRDEARGGAGRSWRHRGPRVPPAGELLRLRYPLVPGQSWVVRVEPRFAARVEGLDVLRLAPGTMPGWRIRYTSELFGPRDRVHVWYGRQGYLKLAYHLEAQATDEYGNVVGTVVSEMTEVLDQYSLVRPSPLAADQP